MGNRMRKPAEENEFVNVVKISTVELEGFHFITRILRILKTHLAYELWHCSSLALTFP